MYFEQRLQSKLNQTFHEAHFIYDVIKVLFEIFCKKGWQLYLVNKRIVNLYVWK